MKTYFGFISAICSFLSLCLFTEQAAQAREPIPDKLVVLTFDDAVKSQFTVVAPILKKHKFGATFFITEGFKFKTDKKNYMTWDEIARLHKDGFEIGNHTRDHMSMNAKNISRIAEQLKSINDRCQANGIPVPTSFAYPGNGIDRKAFPILRKMGIKFARRGGAPEYPYKEGNGFAYEPGFDHPLLIPSAGDARPNWTLKNFKRAVDQAKFGRIAVLQFHGVPDLVHPWVHSPVERFREYMQYLADHDFTVIALRDLKKYVDPEVTPNNPFGIVEDRKAAMKAKKSRDNFRRPHNDSELKYWLQNMVWYHRFSKPEMRMALGYSTQEIKAALKKYDIRRDNKPVKSANGSLLVMPYPGGRHPRIGFRDGMIRPQRETKISVFLPWDETQYIVLDLPEAIRRDHEPKYGLLYLAHTHVETMWTKRGIDLKPLEWSRHKNGSLSVQRTLPNGVSFGTKVIPMKNSLRMEMWLENGSTETLRNLRVQNCMMFRGATDFAQRDNKNKVFQSPYVAAKSNRGQRWIIAAWSNCKHAWGNTSCPCMHSDPQFPDCSPGETKRLHGRIWFYEGKDIHGEFERLSRTGWAKPNAR